MKNTNKDNLNEILVMRRQKLEELRKENKDPFIFEKYDV